MRNKEDYLDSLLKSVTDTGEQEYETENLDAEDEFLRNFEQGLLDVDDQTFMDELGLEMEADAKDMTSPIELESPQLEFEPAAFEDAGGLMVNTMEQDDLFGIDEPDMTKEELKEDDLEAMLNAAMNLTDVKTTAPAAEADVEEQDILDIISDISSGEDLEDIQNILKAHDNEEILPREDLTDMAKDLSEEMDHLGFADEEDSLENETEIFQEEEEPDGKKAKKQRKKKKEKNKKDKNKEAAENTGEGKESFFKKLSRIIFGEDESEITIPEEGDVENISAENIDILKNIEKEKQEEKKAKAAEKKKAKDEKKEQSKAEKIEKKEQKNKEKLAKLEKKNLEAPLQKKSKPLPKKQVILIFILCLSIVLLVSLGSKLIGYSLALEEAKDSYSRGNYIEAYTSLTGMDLKEVDLPLYNKARLNAYLQKEWESYQVYIGQDMNAEALDALLCAVGKYDKYKDAAKDAGVKKEYQTMISDIKSALKQQFSVTVEEARTVYGQAGRSEYTVQLYELLERAGLDQ